MSVPVVLLRYRTRRKSFDDLVIQEVRFLVAICSDSSAIKYGVEDVLSSGLAPWERDAVVLSHGFSIDPHRGLDPQVMVYCHLLEQRTHSIIELREMICAVVFEESARLLGKHPEDVDPGW